MPQVSVVMPVYNGEKYLAEAIDSILSQTFTDFEFIIVDDGSSRIVRTYQERDERVRLVQLERNVGKADARNRGIDAATGEYIAVMDSDDICFPKRLEKQASFLQSHPNIGLVGTFLETASADLTGRQKHEYPQQHAFIVLYWVFGRTTVAGAAFMARRSILMSVGGYENSRRIVDDTELFSRLFYKTRFANLPDALYLYRQHDQQSSASAGRRQEWVTEGIALRQRWLNRLWGEAPRSTLDRFKRLRSAIRISWREWWLLRRDVKRLINGMDDANILDASDMLMVKDEIDRRLERVSPRRWQQFCHWRRRHFQRRK